MFLLLPPGKIDELNLDFAKYELSVVEFKTRMRRSLPGRAQKLTHSLQTMIYKRLLDDLILGRLEAAEVWRALKLDSEKAFGDDVQKHVDSEVWDCRNLSQLFSQLQESVQGLPEVSKIRVEYTFQEDGEPFASEEVTYDGALLRETLSSSLEYWLGSRRPRGVDIEDAWKCGTCEYSDGCEWRRRKEEELRNKNKAQ